MRSSIYKKIAHERRPTDSALSDGVSHCLLHARWIIQAGTTAPVPFPAYSSGIIPVKAHQHIEAIHDVVFHPHGDLTTTSRSSIVRAAPHPHDTCFILLFPTCYYPLMLSSFCKNEYAIYRSPSRLPFTCLNTGVLTCSFHQLYRNQFVRYSVILLWWWKGFKPVDDGTYKDELSITGRAF
jgi:hypothetical protein